MDDLEVIEVIFGCLFEIISIAIICNDKIHDYYKLQNSLGWYLKINYNLK